MRNYTPEVTITQQHWGAHSPAPQFFTVIDADTYIGLIGSVHVFLLA